MVSSGVNGGVVVKACINFFVGVVVAFGVYGSVVVVVCLGVDAGSFSVGGHGTLFSQLQ